MLLQLFLLSLGSVIGWGLYSLTEKSKTISLNSIFIPKNRNQGAARLASAILLGVLYFIITDKLLISIERINFSELIILITVLAIFTDLIFLAIYDLKHFEVQGLVSAILLIFLLLINVGILFVNISGILLWKDSSYAPLSNLFAGIVGGSLTGLIYLVTKKKGIGEGDIRMAVIMGLILGITKLIIAFYITILSASLVGIIYAIYIKTFKGVKIPFLPFIILGIIVAFFYSEEIITAIQNLMLR